MPCKIRCFIKLIKISLLLVLLHVYYKKYFKTLRLRINPLFLVFLRCNHKSIQMKKSLLLTLIIINFSCQSTVDKPSDEIIGYEVEYGNVSPMLGDKSNLTISEQYFTAYDQKKIEVLDSLEHEDVEWLTMDGFTVNGRDEHIAMVKKLWKYWDSIGNDFKIKIMWTTKTKLVYKDQTEDWETICLYIYQGEGENIKGMQRIADVQILDNKIRKIFQYQRPWVIGATKVAKLQGIEDNEEE